MCSQLHGGARRAAIKAISLVVLSGSWLYSTLPAAGELLDLALHHEHGRYQLKLEMIIQATPRDVHAVITDYRHIYRLNPSIVESEVLDTPDDSFVRIRTLINDCILVFCREIHRVEDVRELANGDIHAVVVPRLSNIKSGISIWQIQPLGGHTRLTYQLAIEPGFFIPPLLGTYLVKNKLRREVLASLENVERIARINGRRSQQSSPVPAGNLPGISRGQDDAN